MQSFAKERRNRHGRVNPAPGDGSVSGPGPHEDAVRDILRAPGWQTKLAGGEFGDAREQEADLVADQVMRMPELPSRSAGAGTGQKTPPYEPLPNRSSGLGQTAVSPMVREILRSPGQPIDPLSLAFMERRFGYDFSKVRIHADPPAAQSAEALGAHAYSVHAPQDYLLESNGTETRWYSHYPEYGATLMVSDLPDMDVIREKLTSGLSDPVFLRSIIQTEEPPDACPPGDEGE